MRCNYVVRITMREGRKEGGRKDIAERSEGGKEGGRILQKEVRRVR